MGKQIKVWGTAKRATVLISLVIAFFLFFLSFVSAQTYAQDSAVDIKVSCLNVNCSVQVSITIEYPNSSIAIDNQSMNASTGFMNYTFSDTNTQGIYKYYTDNGFSDSFTVNYRGDSISSAQGVLYISLFLVLIFFFVIVILGINQLPRSNQQDEEGRILSITYLKYFRPVGWMFEYILVVAILYLSSNLAFAYLNEQLFANILFVLFRLSLMAAPIVVTLWIIWIFVQMFHDRQLQNLLNRGFFPQGKL